MLIDLAIKSASVYSQALLPSLDYLVSLPPTITTSVR